MVDRYVSVDIRTW